MKIFSATLFETIKDQLAGIVETIRVAGTNEELAGVSLRVESSRLYNDLFDILSHGESLPFFRQNYMELSGNIDMLAGKVMRILGLRTMLSVKEWESLSGLLEAVKEAVSIFYSTWVKVERNIPESVTEIKLAGRPLGRAEEIVRGLNQLALSAGEPTRSIYLAELANSTIASLEAIDLSFKKLIVIIKL